VSTHLTEDEQVEALKKWWSENGKSVVAGIVIGLGIVFGWQGWGQHQKSQAEQASAEYDRMLLALGTANTEAGFKQAEKLKVDFPGSAYDYFAAMQVAKTKVEADDLQAARLELEHAINIAGDDNLAQLARLRLVSVLIAMNKLDEAQKEAGKAGNDAFAGDFAAYRGDIARARGDLETARSAYQEALDKQASNPEFVRMKLNEIKSS
jgi:predicted negative regulator of RcsB-dependent stress response